MADEARVRTWKPMRSSVKKVPKVSAPGRFIVVETITHQATGAPATSTPHRFARNLDTDEEPYKRRITVTNEWAPIETGHLDRAVQLLLRNLEVDPSKIVALGGESGRTILVYPGESCRFQPEDLGDWCVRCAAGIAKCNLVLLPG